MAVFISEVLGRPAGRCLAMVESPGNELFCQNLVMSCTSETSEPAVQGGDGAESPALPPAVGAGLRASRSAAELLPALTHGSSCPWSLLLCF